MRIPIRVYTLYNKLPLFRSLKYKTNRGVAQFAAIFSVRNLLAVYKPFEGDPSFLFSHDNHHYPPSLFDFGNFAND